ncbi:MAG: hypothetical protein ACFBSF_22010 [Leptolyngbyaceae cyanobacterium]
MQVIIVYMIGIVLQYIGMHRISNSVFLDLVTTHPQCTIVVKRASLFTTARRYILFLDGGQVYTISNDQMDLPPTVTLIPSFFRHG